MALENETIRHLEAERKKLAQQVKGLEDQISDLEEDIDAIDALLGKTKVEPGPNKSLRAVIKSESTFRAAVVATVRFLDRKVRPVEVAEEIKKTGLFEPEGLKGRVATEMFKLGKMGALLSDKKLYEFNPDYKG